MADKQYIYQVARIRSKEMELLTGQNIQQLLASDSYDSCLRVLSDRGWDVSSGDADTILAIQRQNTWALMEELVEDISVFDVFLYQNDFHNLKAAIKQVCTQEHFQDIYIPDGTVEPQQIEQAVSQRDFGALPPRMQKAAQEAFTALLRTGDGQLCDVIIDSACLAAILQAGRDSGDALILAYAELTVAAADIKTAVRCQRTGKELDFLKRALVPCDSLDAAQLAAAVADSEEAIYSYLERTAYAPGVEALRQSSAAFERWCDDLMMQRIRPQLHNAFTIGPLAAYILARENEEKTVRIILSGKKNHLDESAVAERVRDMYV